MTILYVKNKIQFKEISSLKLNFFFFTLLKEHCFLKGNIAGCYLFSFNFKKQQNFYYAHLYLILYILLLNDWN